MVLPKLLTPDPKVFTYGSFVPKDHVLNPVGFASGVQHETLVVFSTCIHHLTKHIETGKHSEEALVQVFSVLFDIVSEDKHVVCVRADHRCHVHHVLCRHHEKDVPMTTIHKQVAHDCVPHECSVVHAIIHKNEYRWQLFFADTRRNFPLTFHQFFDGFPIVVSIDKEVRNKLLVMSVAIFGAGHGNPCRNVPLVPQNISDEGRLSSATLAYKDTHLVVSHLCRVKLPERNVCHLFCNASNFENEFNAGRRKK